MNTMLSKPDIALIASQTQTSAAPPANMTATTRSFPVSIVAGGASKDADRIRRLADAAHEEIEQAMATHRKPALTFSGGKDSLACLYLLRPWWGRVTVLWANAGDPYPETVEQMARIRTLVPHFVEVVGPGYIQRHGLEQTYPADMVPLAATPMGRAVEAAGPRFTIHSRFDCCTANWWIPLNNKVNELGIDLMIRGDRDSEEMTNPAVRSGKNPNGGSYLLPLRHWAKADVFNYLNAEGVEIPRQYAYGMGSLDCMHCTAYLNESGSKLRYLRDFHPTAATEYERRLRLIASAQDREHRLTQIALGELEPVGTEGCGD